MKVFKFLKFTLLLMALFIGVASFKVESNADKPKNTTQGDATAEVGNTELDKQAEQEVQKNATSNNLKAVESYIDGMENGTVSERMQNLNKTTVGLASEGYSILKILVVIAVLIAFIIGTVMMAAGNSGGRQAGKERLVKVALCICAIGAVSSFIVLIWDMGSSLF